MGTIRVEYTPVKSYFLGLLKFDHIQIVYQDETSFVDRQDHWYVLEGTKDGGLFGATLGVQGEEAYISLAAVNGASRDALVDKIGTPESRGSRVIYTGSQALSLWDQMSDYGTELQIQAHPYTGFSLPFGPSPTINSSSAVATMLWSVGIDINFLMPFGIRFSPGTTTLLGTTQVDEIQLGGSFTQVAGGLGEDILRGSGRAASAEKFYGGNDDDRIYWSDGINFIHGGEPNLNYVDDGQDTVDYSGAGHVKIVKGLHVVEHKTPTFFAIFEGGTDQLFSIEKVSWLRGRDVVTVSEGLEILEVPIEFDFDDSPSGGTGDELIFKDSVVPLIINVVDDSLISIQTIANAGQDAGIWAHSVESITGSAGDDIIYAGATVTVVDGGKGDDVLDGRLAVPFSELSPLAYDIELYGNDGDDTIVSGAGWTIGHGGDGRDIFVLSGMGTGDYTPEFVILDATSDDKIYIPHDLFKTQRGEYEGSDLFQISGAPFKIDEFNDVAIFAWGLPDENVIDGFIEFAGEITFVMDGADLLITLYQGHPESYRVDNGPGEPPGPEMTRVAVEFETQALIRVIDWQDGDLGITFPETFDFVLAVESGDTIEDYPGWKEAVHSATGASRFIDGLDERPDSHLPQELRDTAVSARAFAPAAPSATEGDDVITMTFGGPFQIEGLGGNDDITGSAGGDRIDGGTGDDVMAGGRGNDTYYVDSAGDRVVEANREGFDKVYSAVDYILGDDVEHLTLTGTAQSGQGNSLRNTIVGNRFDNTLAGGDGDDTLAGNEGDDELRGGAGGDGYVYEAGDGNDIIIDAPGDAGKDVIVLAGNYVQDDVRFYRDPSAMDDLILRFAGGGSITVRDHFNGSAIETVEFVTGEVWTSAEVQERAATAIVTSNDVPDARPDSYIYAGTGSFTVSRLALLDNDSDSDGDALQITSVTGVSQGSAALDTDGNILITPGSGASSVNFRYWVSDGRGGTSSALAEIALFPNRPPQIISAQLAPVVEDAQSAGRIFATDADGDSLIYRIKDGAGPHLGSVVFGEDGHFLYRPNENAFGADAFTIVVTDALSGTAEYTFNPIISARNDNPLAFADALGNVQAGSTKVIAASVLLGNDRDIDGDVLRVSSVSGAVGGTVTLSQNGDILFAAARNYSGAASFTYTVSDGHGGTAQASASLSVFAAPAVDRHVFIGTNRNDTLTGTNEDDVFYGKNGNDMLIGRGGNDVFEVRGHAGQDVFNGGSGYDTIRGGKGNDVIIVKSNQSNLISIEKIDGGAGKHDAIVGTKNRDNFDFSKIAITGIERISLGAGDDTILGSKGNDAFSGGAGQDTFRFKTGHGHDVVLDFYAGSFAVRDDKLDLRETGIKNYLTLIENIRQVGNDTVITLDHQSSITLKNVAPWTLSFENFQL